MHLDAGTDFKSALSGVFRNADRNAMDSDDSKSGLKNLLRVSKAKYDNEKL